MRSDRDALLSLQKFVAGIYTTLDGDTWDIRRAIEPGIEPVRPYALVEQTAPAVTDGAPNAQEVVIAFSVNLYLPKPENGSRQTADDVALDIRESMWLAVKVGENGARPTTDRIQLYSYQPRIAVHRWSVRGATSGTYTVQLAGGDETGDLDFDAGVTDVQAALDDLLDVDEDRKYLVAARGQGIFDVAYIGALEGSDPALVTIDDALLVMDGAPTSSVVLHGAMPPWRSPSDWMRVESFGQETIRDPDDPALQMVAVDLRCTFVRGLRLPFEQMMLQSISL